LQNVVTVDELRSAIEELPNIYICRELMAYISSLVEATRTYPRVTLGVSPRGALALMRAAKGYAAIAGRDYVLPDDIKRASHPVLEHRLQLENSLRIRKNAATEIIDDILSKTTVPTEAVFEARA
jgi:MoxR-like ATPase